MMESGRLRPAFFVLCPKLPPKPFTLPFTHTRTHYQHINHPRQPEPPHVHPSSLASSNPHAHRPLDIRNELAGMINDSNGNVSGSSGIFLGIGPAENPLYFLSSR